METTEAIVSKPITFADKILYSCNKFTDGRNKRWFAFKLGMSRVTLDRRLNDNSWSDGEIEVLKSIFK